MQPVFSTNANPEQSEATRTTDAPLLIIAGPGSGKTFTLLEQIVYLITQKGVPPEILLGALYQKHLEKNYALDFSTIQLNALKLLQSYLNFRVELQQKFIYLIVDEYKDTNTILDFHNLPRRKHVALARFS